MFVAYNVQDVSHSRAIVPVHLDRVESSYLSYDSYHWFDFSKKHKKVRGKLGNIIPEEPWSPYS